jgi:ADP-ribosylglycohydrolase
MLGLALGDALGFVVEAAPAEVALAYARDELSTMRLPPRAHRDFPFGQYSDDTQLARALLLGVRDAGRWDPPAFAARVVELFAPGRAVGAGPGSRAAAERLSAGMRWQDAGTPPPYAGNGGAMRVAPLGALLAHDLSALVDAAATQSRVTHGDPRCAGGAVAVAAAAALVGMPGPLESTGLVREVAAMVAPVNREMADVVAAVEGWLELSPPDARERLRRAGLDPTEAAEWRGISTHVAPSVAWSLYAALRNPDDYWTAVRTAIEPGGDTDSMAAMAGGIVGARVGKAGLPNALLCALTDRGEWRANALEALARECAACAAGRPAD